MRPDYSIFYRTQFYAYYYLAKLQRIFLLIKFKVRLVEKSKVEDNGY